MTNEERDFIANFISRVGGSPQPANGSFMGGNAPSQPALPPVDKEADAFIAQQMRQFPEAAYRITQTAIVQEAAFAEAQNRIKRLEWELEQTRNALQQAAQQAPQSKGFLSGLFGGGQQQPRPPQQQAGQPWGQPQGQPMGQPAWGGYQPTSAPPQPQYAPGYQPGMFQRGGSGFLGSALTTAAGVAGGMVVGNALMNAFQGHHGGSDMASNSGWGGASNNTSGNVFDGAGTTAPDMGAGFGTPAGFGAADPYAGGGEQKDSGFASQENWGQSGGNYDSGSADPGAGSVDSGGGGFDSGGFDNS